VAENQCYYIAVLQSGQVHEQCSHTKTIAYLYSPCSSERNV